MELHFVLTVALALSLGAAALAFWIWMLIDCIRHEPREGNDRLVWLIVIVAAKLVGAVVYFFARFRKRARLETG